jgi:hypothetical protein
MIANRIPSRNAAAKRLQKPARGPDGPLPLGCVGGTVGVGCSCKFVFLPVLVTGAIKPDEGPVRKSAS